jgi:glutathione-regulated potassium-efflux system ancillary protein KefG
MKKILVISGHPNMENSVFTKQILEKFKTQSNITINQLVENKTLDVAKEQDLLINHDVIVFQFPLWWYGVPSVMKNYIDKVFGWGFAYGDGGDKLKGKTFLMSTTTGGDKVAYSQEGYNRFPVADFLKPLNGLIHLSQGKYAPEYVIYSCNPNPQSQIKPDAFNGEIEKLLANINSL